MKLLQLDSKTFINVDKIVQITITNLLEQTKQRHIQRSQFDITTLNWQVSIYLKSTGDNPQRLTFDFNTEKQAKDYISSTFGLFIKSQ